MTDEIEHTPRQSSPWAVAITCSLLVVLLAVGGMFAMRDRLLGELQAEAETQNEAREKLATRIEGLKANIEGMANVPSPESEAVGALNTKLEEMTTTLNDVNTRLTALEKHAEEAKATAVVAPAPAPAPVAPAAVAEVKNTDVGSALRLAAVGGKPFSAELAAWQSAHSERAQEVSPLAAFAEKGLPSEAALIADLQAAMGEEKPAAESGIVGKINTHLSGLVSIKKSASADPLANLRKAARSEPLSTLKPMVAGLPENERALFAAWEANVAARDKALAALELIGEGR